MALLESPRQETQERDWERRERKGEGSAAQFVASKGLGFLFLFFVFHFPPFSYVKSAGKVGSSLKGQ